MRTQHKLKPGNIYAVHSGIYAGEMLVYISQTPQYYNFLAVPTMLNRNVPKESYDLAWNSDIIKYVDKAPKEILKVCLHQYTQNEKSNN